MSAPCACLVLVGMACEPEGPDPNMRAREDLRQARDIVRMWEDRVGTATLPSFKPSRARQLLDAVIASRADEEVKAEARGLLADLARRPHYVAFAERAREFVPHVEEYLKLDGTGDALDKLPDGKLVVLWRRKRDLGQKEPDVTFEAEMVEACGDRAAATPDEVRAVVLVDAEQQVVGEYRVTGMKIGDKKIDFDGLPKNGRRAPLSYRTRDAYGESCGLTVREFPSGRLVAMRRFGAVDPDELDAKGRANSAQDQVRAKVAEYLKGLAAGKP